MFECLVLYLAQQFAHHWGIFLVVGIPALLIVVIGIGGAVGIAESDVLDIVVSGLRDGGTEIICQSTVAQRVFTRKQIHQQAFSGTVRTYDSDMFSVEKIESDGLG